MKTVISVLTAHFFVLSAFIWLASPACADSGSDYKAGSDFAKQVQGNGLNSLRFTTWAVQDCPVSPTMLSARDSVSFAA